MNRLRFLRHYFLSLMILNLAACSTVQTVSIEQAMQNSPPPGIDYGSLVEIETLDKKSYSFRVTEIGNDGLGGSRGYVRYADMKSLRLENPARPEGSSNAGAVILGILGVIGMVALISSADHVSVCAPAPCPQPPQPQ
jgi:hypothetical protein